MDGWLFIDFIQYTIAGIRVNFESIMRECVYIAYTNWMEVN